MSPAKSATATPTSSDAPNTRSTGPLAVEMVETYQEFLALQDEWQALLDHQGEASIFLHHGWVDAAWRWRRHEGTPMVLLARESGNLRGVMALLAQKDGKRGRFLSWLSVPDNQECDLVCAPEQREPVLAAFAEWLTSQAPRWSALELAQIRVTSPTLTALRQGLRRNGIPAADSGRSINYAIDLSSDWQSYYGSKSRRLKKGNNLVANRLNKTGAVAIERLTGADITPEIVDTLVRLSTASWKQSTGTTFDHPGPRNFLDGLVERGAAGGWLVVWLLKLDNEAVASEVHVEYGGRAHALRADYAEVSEGLSPGTYLNWKIIERLFDSDLVRYELGPGDNPYKQRWTDDGLKVTTVNAWPPTLTGRVQALWQTRMRPALSALKHRYTGSRD